MARFAHLTQQTHAVLLFDELEEYHEAIAELSSHISANEKAGIAFHNRACAYWEIGQTDKALRDFAAAIELLPHDYLPAQLKGMLLEKLGRLDEAIASLDRAANISPNEATVRRTRAGVLTKAARFREALADFDHAIRLEPGCNSARKERRKAARQLKEEERCTAPKRWWHLWRTWR